VCWSDSCVGCIVTCARFDAEFSYDDMQEKFPFLKDQDGFIHRDKFEEWLNNQFLNQV
jgi:hypothetical protein